MISRYVLADNPRYIYEKTLLAPVAEKTKINEITYKKTCLSPTVHMFCRADISPYDNSGDHTFSSAKGLNSLRAGDTNFNIFYLHSSFLP